MDLLKLFNWFRDISFDFCVIYSKSFLRYFLNYPLFMFEYICENFENYCDLPVLDQISLFFHRENLKSPSLKTLG